MEREKRKERARKSLRREGERQERCFSNEEKVERERETRLPVQVGKVLQNYDVAFLLSRNAHAGAGTELDVDGDQGCCLPPGDVHDRVSAEKFKAPRAAKCEVQSSTRSKLLIETVVL